MKLPKKLEFKAFAFMSLANGGHRQLFKNEKYGIIVDNFKESRDHKWVKTFSAKRFHNKIFHTGKKLVEMFAKVKEKS